MSWSPHDKLTARQRDVLVYITAYWRTHKRSPKLKEIAGALDYQSVAGAQRVLKNLERRGQIYRGVVPVSVVE